MGPKFRLNEHLNKKKTFNDNWSTISDYTNNTEHLFNNITYKYIMEHPLLLDLQNKFVTNPVDKAAFNYAVKCNIEI